MQRERERYSVREETERKKICRNYGILIGTQIKVFC